VSKVLGRLPVSVISIVVVVFLVAEVTILLPRAANGPLGASAVLLENGPTYSSARFSLVARYGVLVAHVALLPGSWDQNVTGLIAYEDPTVPIRYASSSDVVGLISRVAQTLQVAGSRIPVIAANATELPGLLARNPHGALLDFGYGSLPSTVFSDSNHLLVSWIMAGGVLIWAGGPLGYFETTPTPNGGVTFAPSMGWTGQTYIAGFALEDPVGNPAIVSAGPLLGTHPSALATALGMMYPGTIDGANRSRLLAEGGSDLGWDTSSGPWQANRTSIASLPRGLGHIYFFGGALWGTGAGVVPNADVELSGDIGMLLITGYLPGQGSAVSQNVLVTPRGTQFLTLGVSGPESQLYALVTTEIGGIYITVWGRGLG
jgi:hypothetical protein